MRTGLRWVTAIVLAILAAGLPACGRGTRISVYDEARRPIAGAKVEAQFYRMGPWGPERSGRAIAWTGRDGQCTMGLGDWHYMMHIYATKRGYEKDSFALMIAGQKNQVPETREIVLKALTQGTPPTRPAP